MEFILGTKENFVIIIFLINKIFDFIRNIFKKQKLFKK